MDNLAGAPEPLLAAAFGGFLLGALPALWMVRRFLGIIRRRQMRSVGMSSYFFALSSSALFLGVSIGATGLLAALHGYAAFTAKTRVAEVQCFEIEPTKLRVYFAPVGENEKVGETETYDVAGDQWAIGGEVLRFRPFLTPLGVGTVHKVTRVEGRWLKAEDAEKNKVTAHDRNGGVSSFWVNMHRYGTSGPFAWLIDGVHGQAVSQFPDRRAIYDLYVTPNGYILDKRSL